MRQTNVSNDSAGMKRLTLSVTAAAAIFTGAPTAPAADTVETWGAGAVDFEIYTGAEGLGLGRRESRLFGETVLGYGLVDRLSAYLRGSAMADQELGDGAAQAGFGLFGTPVDTDYFDVDLFFDIGFGHDGLALTPSFEVNGDLAPDLALGGVYLRGEEVFAARSVEPDEAQDEQDGEVVPDSELAPAAALTLGLYWTAAEHHQVLVETDCALAHNPGEGEEVFDLGGVALGYNLVLHDAIELITQVFLDVPLRSEEPVAPGFSLGFIATIDGVGPRQDPEHARREAAALNRDLRLR